MITRNTGMDLLPLHDRPSHPRARLRAVQNARARREREAPPPDEAFDAERLRRDLASLPPDVVVNGEEREHLRKMGWTDARYARAEAVLREDVGRRVHPRADPVVAAAGAGGPATRSRPSSPSSPTDADARGMVANMKAAWARGVDPYEEWPSLRGLLASGGADRPAKPDQGRREPRTPRLAGSTTTPGDREALRATRMRPRRPFRAPAATALRASPTTRCFPTSGGWRRLAGRASRTASGAPEATDR